MLKKRLSPRPTLKPKLTTRRPPQAYVDLLTKPERDFQEYVQELERDPAFRELVRDGVITTMRFGQRIPRHKYQEHMDEKLFLFLEESGITKHDGWADDLLAPSATLRARELAEKYKVPVGDMTRYLRYLASTSRDDLLSRRPISPMPSSEPAYDPLDDAGEDPEIDLSDIIDITRRFVETYRLTEREFLEQVLCSDMTPEELAQTHGCSIPEAEQVLEAAGRIQIAESYESPRIRSSTTSGSPVRPVEVIARIELTDECEVATQFAHDSMYVHRYRIDPVLLEGESAGTLNQRQREILASARYVNQRLSTLSRLIGADNNTMILEEEYLWAFALMTGQVVLDRRNGVHCERISRIAVVDPEGVIAKQLAGDPPPILAAGHAVHNGRVNVNDIRVLHQLMQGSLNGGARSLFGRDPRCKEIGLDLRLAFYEVLTVICCESGTNLAAVQFHKTVASDSGEWNAAGFDE